MLTPRFEKAVRQTEKSRLERLLAQQKSTIQKAFAHFVVEVKSPKTMRQVRQLLEKNDIGGAMRIVDQHIVTFGSVIPAAITSAGINEVNAVAAKVGSRAVIALNFDPSNERAAALMRGNKLRFVQEFTSNQRAATRQAIATAFAEGQSLQQAANAFKNSIGLTQYQMGAVDNYRALLEKGSVEALRRELRDRRFDPTVLRAGEDPLTEEQIDRMVDRYRGNMLAARAETIARTEGHTVLGQARREASRQIAQQLGLNERQIARTWRTVKDGRERDSHHAMNGQTVLGMDTPYTTPDGDELLFPGDPSAPAKERINCRCTEIIRILSEDEAAELAA